MSQIDPNLGLCFFGNNLFYAINDQDEPRKLARIGSFDFNFDVTEVLVSGNEKHSPGIKKTILQLKEQHSIQHIRMLSLPHRECWTTLPKLAYDNADEREDHIRILMSDSDRSKVHPTWYDLSNQDYKFLLLRNETSLRGMQKLAATVSTTDLVSEFEIGDRWINHSEPGGSFMTFCCFEHCITVSSFILGKLRGAIYITYDDPEDLPYLWLQRTKELSWMEGLHEKLYVYGNKAYQVIEILEPFWDDAGTVIKMDTLEKMQVSAEEETYGFNLEKAFPAILLALE